MTTSSNDDHLPDTPSYMTTTEVAALLRTSPETVRYWRHISYGPLGLKIGRHVLYPQADVEAWIAQRRTEAERGTADS